MPAAKSDRAAKLKIEGIEFIPRYKRDYPRDWSASQLLGSTGTDEQGLGGLEYRFDKQLRGADGERRMVKDAMGNPIEMRDTKPVAPGHDVAPHARRQPPGPHRGSAQRGRPRVAARRARPRS